MSQRILIIGCGYLGFRAAKRWVDEQDHVFALTRSRAEEFEQAGIEPIVGDVLRTETLNELPEVDLLLYAVGYDRTQSVDKRSVYVDGLRNVLNVMQGRARQLIYVSSTSVYGQSHEEWIDESSPCFPSTDSGEICLDAEQLVEDFACPQNSILRLSGIYGPQRLLARLESLKEEKPLPGDPEGWLNLIHVDDAVNAVRACYQSNDPPPLLLVSDDRPIPRREYYETLAQVAGTPAPKFDTSLPTRSSGRNKRCLNKRLRELLDGSLDYPTIHEGLPHAVNVS